MGCLQFCIEMQREKIKKAEDLSLISSGVSLAVGSFMLLPFLDVCDSASTYQSFFVLFTLTYCFWSLLNLISLVHVNAIKEQNKNWNTLNTSLQVVQFLSTVMMVIGSLLMRQTLWLQIVQYFNPEMEIPDSINLPKIVITLITIQAFQIVKKSIKNVLSQRTLNLQELFLHGLVIFPLLLTLHTSEVFTNFSTLTYHKDKASYLLITAIISHAAGLLLLYHGAVRWYCCSYVEEVKHSYQNVGVHSEVQVE